MHNLAPLPAAFAFGQVDSTSTSTIFTATVPNVGALYDGLCIYLKNGVVTSATNWTLNINGLGAKPVYQTQELEARTTSIFNIKYTALFIYNSSRVDGGCWDYFYGYNTDAATAAPLMDGTAAVGSSAKYAKEDHVHPSDTSKANVSSVPSTASVGSNGLITFKNSNNTSLFTLQLPIYQGGAS